MSRLADEVRRRTDESRTRHGLPALVIGACGGGAGPNAIVEAAGLADAGTGREVQPSSQFRIGSITKTFTAAVTLLLAERGVLDLDSLVEDHLPGTPIGQPRLRQLLSHCGGTQREAPLPMWSTMQGPDDDELLACLPRARMVADPGARWHYSNLGYAVLGQIMRTVTGRTCQDLIDIELLGPLGLEATTWQPTPAAVHGYRLDPATGQPIREPVMEQAAIGVGGQLWSTPADLLTWGNALIGGAPAILPAAVVDAMHTPQVLVDPHASTQAWGLGLILDHSQDRVLSGHTGAMPGFLAALSLDRETGLVVTCLTNVTRGIPLALFTRDLMHDLQNDIVHDPTGTDPNPKITAQPASQPAQPTDDEGTGYPDEVAAVLGVWWCESDETIFTWRDGHLRAHLSAAPQTSATTFSRYDHANDGQADGGIGAEVYIASTGRLQGELLLVLRKETGTVAGLEWATYPYTREPS